MIACTACEIGPVQFTALLMLAALFLVVLVECREAQE